MNVHYFTSIFKPYIPTPRKRKDVFQGTHILNSIVCTFQFFGEKKFIKVHKFVVAWFRYTTVFPEIRLLEHLKAVHESCNLHLSTVGFIIFFGTNTMSKKFVLQKLKIEFLAVVSHQDKRSLRRT